MTEKYSLCVWLDVDADSPEEAVADVLSRVGEDTAVDKVMGEDGVFLDPDDIMPPALEIALDRSPANCQQTICCRGLLRHNGKPLCQQTPEEMGELLEAVQETADQIKIPGLSRLVKAVSKKFGKTLAQR